VLSILAFKAYSSMLPAPKFLNNESRGVELVNFRKNSIFSKNGDTPFLHWPDVILSKTPWIESKTPFLVKQRVFTLNLTGLLIITHMPKEFRIYDGPYSYLPICVEPDLRGADLRGADLRGARFCGEPDFAGS
jgi:hypothetical protein